MNVRATDKDAAWRQWWLVKDVKKTMRLGILSTIELIFSTEPSS